MRTVVVLPSGMLAMWSRLEEWGRLYLWPSPEQGLCNTLLMHARGGAETLMWGACSCVGAQP
eukprot:3128922-Alexandrium_andersonii.AAC.1